MNDYDPNNVQVIISGSTSKTDLVDDVESFVIEPCDKPYTYRVLPENIKLLLDTMKEMGADKVYTSPAGYSYLESIGFDMSKVGLESEQ